MTGKNYLLYKRRGLFELVIRGPPEINYANVQVYGIGILITPTREKKLDRSIETSRSDGNISEMKGRLATMTI